MKIKNILPELVLGACAGIAIGTSIELIFSASVEPTYTPGMPSFLEQYSNIHIGVLIERVVYALYGVICALAGRIYKNENRPLVLSTAMNVAIIAGCGLSVGFYLHWWRNVTEFFGSLATILIVYLVIWIALYLHARTNVNKLNKQLKANNPE